MKEDTQIKCPNCGTSIDVQDILAHQLEEEIKQKYQSQIAEEKKRYEFEQEKLRREKAEFLEKKKQENEQCNPVRVGTGFFPPVLPIQAFTTPPRRCRRDAPSGPPSRGDTRNCRRGRRQTARGRLG